MSSPGLPTLVSVNRVWEVRVDGPRGGRTAIDKRPVGGTVGIGRLGVDGDQQIDRLHHGGPDQALYAFAREALDHWAGELGRDLAPGTFGENLTTLGLDLRGARTGDRWRIGAPADPAHVVVEVTTPRIPCATFARWLGEPSWVKRFAAYGESGCYLRVLRAGRLSAGAPIEVLVRGTGPTMGEQLATEMNLGA